ncbi:MAG: bifunctional 4-hydroxy-2-oxoglutarate aldolase/2-dehydro-3-deoxy-phosphogluconate aldolase [Candidatus Omnitrophica bacterium]|nr:bifunctional 4-hydroxy-2-oxoglutarate aldolase/2-dehydro-3-deoxy-phosphogluconate aldolase [Candidatus Omnitrophota bacterium]
MKIEEFKKLPILGILRGIEPEIIEPLIQAVIASGLKTIEITMNTKSAPELIKKTVQLADGHLTIGAGTVLTMQDLKLALDSGATFIVSPVVVKEVMEYCVKNKIPVFPGALTPQEIFQAWQMGATMVKVFPAKFFGPEYFKEIKGPFNDIELLACAGVTAENLRTYFSSGASAVSFGAGVFKREWLLSRDFASITRVIRGFLQEYRLVGKRG